jgi:hypothetical protein
MREKGRLDCGAAAFKVINIMKIPEQPIETLDFLPREED